MEQQLCPGLHTHFFTLARYHWPTPQEPCLHESPRLCSSPNPCSPSRHNLWVILTTLKLLFPTCPPCIARSPKNVSFLFPSHHHHSGFHTASLKRSSHLYLFLAEKCRRPRSPQQLTEAVLVILLQEASLECPQPVGIVHLQNSRGNPELLYQVT